MVPGCILPLAALPEALLENILELPALLRFRVVATARTFWQGM